MRSLPSILPLVCVLVLGSTFCSYADDNETPEAQKAWTSYSALDKELKDLYQKTLISLDNAKARENLTNAENAFVEYREAQGTFVAMGVNGQKPDKLVMAQSFTKSTEARLDELKKWVASQKTK